MVVLVVGVGEGRGRGCSGNPPQHRPLKSLRGDPTNCQRSCPPDSRWAGRIFRNLGGIRGAGAEEGGDSWGVAAGEWLCVPLPCPPSLLGQLGGVHMETPSSCRGPPGGGSGPSREREGGSRQFPAFPPIPSPPRALSPGRRLEATPPGASRPACGGHGVHRPAVDPEGSPRP